MNNGLPTREKTVLGVQPEAPVSTDWLLKVGIIIALLSTYVLHPSHGQGHWHEEQMYRGASVSPRGSLATRLRIGLFD